jgi:hypothetical protein
VSGDPRAPGAGSPPSGGSAFLWMFFGLGVGVMLPSVLCGGLSLVTMHKEWFPTLFTWMSAILWGPQLVVAGIAASQKQQPMALGIIVGGVVFTLLQGTCAYMINGLEHSMH